MELIINPEVANVVKNYPEAAQRQLKRLRALVVKTAQETEGIKKLEETLKWGEPSYLTKQGSTIRMDWKAKKPEQFALYFKCTSQLVPTFKKVYANTFQFEGNRAIVFDLKDQLPEEELKHCITMALTYHKIKHLPLLGA